MAELLGRGARPDAVFAYNDLIALGAMRTLAERGLRVPEDIAVVGFDDIEESRYGAIGLTTVQPDKQAIARHAVDRLVARLAGGTVTEPRRIRPGYRLAVRESTGGAHTVARPAGSGRGLTAARPAPAPHFPHPPVPRTPHAPTHRPSPAVRHHPGRRGRSTLAPRLPLRRVRGDPHLRGRPARPRRPRRRRPHRERRPVAAHARPVRREGPVPRGADRPLRQPHRPRPLPLGGTVHEIPVNDRGHALHGGPRGFDGRVWEAEPFTDGDTAGLRLRLHSPDGDMGFPGALDVTAVYALDAAGTLALDCAATTDRTTVVNLSHHAYFNLAADGGDVLDHTLGVDGAGYLPVDPDGIPSARSRTSREPLRPDLPAPPRRRRPGRRRRAGLPRRRLRPLLGALRRRGGETAVPRRAARLAAPGGTRAMEVWTTAPGSRSTRPTSSTAPSPAPGPPAAAPRAVCLEPQHFPDAPNRPAYPSAALEPGTTGRRRTEFRFPGLPG